MFLSRGYDDTTGIVFNRALIYDHPPAHEFLFGCVGLFANGFRHHLVIIRYLDDSFLQSPAHEMRNGLPFSNHVGIIHVDLGPIPFCSREIPFRGKLRLVAVITGAIDTSLFSSRDNDLGAVDMAGDDIDALID